MGLGQTREVWSLKKGYKFNFMIYPGVEGAHQTGHDVLLGGDGRDGVSDAL